jgi:uncharacterized protein (TIGR03435 family)
MRSSAPIVSESFLHGVLTRPVTFCMTGPLRSVGIAVLLFTAASGQTTSNAPKFEVASVRPSVWRPPVAVGGARSGGDGATAGGGCPQRLNIDRGRVRIECADLPMLIAYAFRLSPDRITGPEWMMSVGATRFDIAATILQGASENQVPEMLQSLLAERFKLVIHRANTSRAIYALVVAMAG